jgi:DNA-binding beta-propeller fold protein YncE
MFQSDGTHVLTKSTLADGMANPRGVALSADGSKLYVVGGPGDAMVYTITR